MNRIKHKTEKFKSWQMFCLDNFMLVKYLLSSILNGEIKITCTCISWKTVSLVICTLVHTKQNTHLFQMAWLDTYMWTHIQNVGAPCMFVIYSIVIVFEGNMICNITVSKPFYYPRY